MNKAHKENSLIKSPWLWTLLALVLIVAFAAFVKLPVSAEPEVVAAEPAQTTEIAEAKVCCTHNQRRSQHRWRMPDRPLQMKIPPLPMHPLPITVSLAIPTRSNCKLLAEEPEEVHSEEAAGEG